MSAFSLLQLLPPELRREIYLYATPPRIVKLEADIEDWDDFWERWPTSSIVDIYVHPESTYFAPLWDQGGRPHPYIHRRTWPKQMTLKQYGFTTQKPRQGHWPLEDRFPFDAILNDQQTVYNLFRRGQFYSNCEIPPLLHTCSDSRRFLIDAGYELAYGTRSHNSKIWFNFKRDILHIRDDNDHNWLYQMFFGSMQRLDSQTTHRWVDHKSDRPVSLFRLHDLRRIRQLVCHLTGPIEDFVDLCYLMPNLQHVYMDPWGNVDAVLPHSTVSHQALSPLPRLERNRSIHHEYMIRLEEVDLIWPDWHSTMLSHLKLCPEYTNSDVRWCMVWKQERGFSDSFFQFAESHMRDLVQSQLDARHATPQARALEGQFSLMREAPKCHFVHISPIDGLENIYYNRQACWEILRQRRESWLQSPDYQEPFGADLQGWNVHPLQSPLSPTTFSMVESIRYLNEHEGLLEWWVRHGYPFTRDTSFQVFP
ncbi:2EXR family [Microdochium nivale]|nr:2EXR family [Microdochium nivale]